MQKEDKIKTYIQDSFREIHAPEDLRRKVMNMNERKEKKSFAWAKKLAVAAAVALAVFAGSNCVAYAMTGSTWVRSIKTIFLVDGVKQEVELNYEVFADGTTGHHSVHHGTFDVPGNGSVAFVIESDQEIGEVPPTVHFVTDSKIPEGMKIVTEDGRVYMKDNGIVIDITDDIADGQADVSYEKDGVAYRYVIEESPYVSGAYDYYLVEE